MMPVSRFSSSATIMRVLWHDLRPGPLYLLLVLEHSLIGPVNAHQWQIFETPQDLNLLA